MSVKMGTPLAELLDLFVEHGVGVIPVVEGNDSKRVVGLVEQRDLLGMLHISKEGK